VIQTDPVGATVTSGGKEIGVTPLTLPELGVGTFQFSLQLAKYEAVAGSLEITGNQTNSFSTNLISLNYRLAMSNARRAFDLKDYDRAAEMAAEALKHRTGDTTATSLQREASTLGLIAEAERKAERGEYVEAINQAKQALMVTPDSARAEELVVEYTKREENRLKAASIRLAEQAALAQQQREIEAADQVAKQRIQELSEVFTVASAAYENPLRFRAYTLDASNVVAVAGFDIQSRLANKQPAFEDIRLVWVKPYLFKLEARQRVGSGYRDCLILGTQVKNELTRIQFKVFEYENPPDKKLLGGIVQVSADFKNSSSDPNAIAANAEQFQRRTQEGVDLVTKRISDAIAP
jgi:tetratricopeptide (TPR) repeat protein